MAVGGEEGQQSRHFGFDGSLSPSAALKAVFASYITGTPHTAHQAEQRLPAGPVAPPVLQRPPAVHAEAHPPPGTTPVPADIIALAVAAHLGVAANTAKVRTDQDLDTLSPSAGVRSPPPIEASLQSIGVTVRTLD